MFLSLKKTLVGSAVVALCACAGPQGEPGPAGAAGPAGPQGPGFTAGASLSAVVPNSVLSGKTLSVQISGFATTWKSSSPPTVDFGSGITVNKVTVASATAIVADITVAEGTQPGSRTVTVTNGTEIAKFETAFSVVPTLAAQATPATVPQLGFGVVTITNNDPALVLSTTDTDYTFTGAPGVNAQFWSVDGKTLTVAVFVDLAAATGAQEVHMETKDAAGNTVALTFPVSVQPAQIQNGDLSMDTTGTIGLPNTSKAFKFTAPNAGTYTVTAQWSDAMATGSPGYIVLDSTGSLMGALAAGSSNSFGIAANADFYVVVYTGATTGDFSFSLAYDPTVTVSDAEPNNTPAQAKAAVLPFSIQNGSLTFTSDESDYYKVTLGMGDVGKSIKIDGIGGYADFAAEILAADGMTSIADSTNLYQSTWSSPALTTAGDYYIRVHTFGVDYDGTYKISAALQ